MASNKTRLGANGRVVIPADLRAELGLNQGDEFNVRTDGRAIVLERPEDALKRIQARWQAIPYEGSMVDDLIAERRKAFAQEEREARGMDEATVLDASALIALFRGESGGDAVAGVVRGSLISTVNLAEVVEASRRLDPLSRGELAEANGAGVIIAAFTASQAELAGSMRAATAQAGLSFADRACLALALELGATAITADRAWTKVDVGVEVKLIR